MSNLNIIKSTASLVLILCATASPAGAEELISTYVPRTTEVAPVGHRKSSCRNKTSCTTQNGCTDKNCKGNNCPGSGSNCTDSNCTSNARFDRKYQRTCDGKGVAARKHARQHGYSSKGSGSSHNGKGHGQYGYNCPPGQYCPPNDSRRCQHCKLGIKCRCHHSPGHGWRPPAKNPIQRTAVSYTKYFPNYWSGQGYGTPIQAHPVVYTPTDTTQLGYSYSRVPFWQPRPGMLPPIPHPSMYHDQTSMYNHRNHYWGNFNEAHKWQHRVNYSDVSYGHGGYYHGGAGYSSCPTCDNGGVVSDGSYPTLAEPTPVDSTQPNATPTPVETSPIAPMPRPKSNTNGSPYNKDLPKGNINKTSYKVQPISSTKVSSKVKESKSLPILVPLPKMK